MSATVPPTVDKTINNILATVTFEFPFVAQVEPWFSELDTEVIFLPDLGRRIEKM